MLLNDVKVHDKKNPLKDPLVGMAAYAKMHDLPKLYCEAHENGLDIEYENIGVDLKTNKPIATIYNLRPRK